MIWGLSLALEVARKTVPPAEERPRVETYSAALGQPRAVMLATGGLTAGWLGAGAYSLALGLPAGPIILVGAAVILGLGATTRRAPRLNWPRATVSLLSLGLLLWPALLALAFEGRP